MASANDQIYGPVLLVCIFNKFGNIITHDYFYQLFSEYGQVQKILIFEKAKVWKTFIEYQEINSARQALKNLNNRPVFDDGSKMNIFSSKLQTIKLQNNNLGGVNYQELKHDPDTQDETIMTRSRNRTLDSPSVTKSPGSCMTYLTDSPFQEEPIKEFSHNSSTYSFGEDQWGQGPFSSNSFGVFDIEEQFREIAMESQEFRQLKKGQEEEQTRKKSKTLISNPHTEQFLLQNSPCKVLFIRSIPLLYNHDTLYNIFKNFGVVERIIYFRDKKSALLEYQEVDQAIVAKDQLNYAKAEMKLFYSHYDTLSMRKQTEGEQFYDYTHPTISNQSQHSTKTAINPPSQTLYLTFVKPNQQQQIEKMCQNIDCPIKNIEWRENQGKKDKWMCLAEFKSIEEALLVMGFLQGASLSNGKKLKISFTKSKIKQRGARLGAEKSSKSIHEIARKKYREKSSCA